MALGDWTPAREFHTKRNGEAGWLQGRIGKEKSLMYMTCCKKRDRSSGTGGNWCDC